MGRVPHNATKHSLRLPETTPFSVATPVFSPVSFHQNRSDSTFILDLYVEKALENAFILGIDKIKDPKYH
jgi:hypothetical protein